MHTRRRLKRRFSNLYMQRGARRSFARKNQPKNQSPFKENVRPIIVNKGINHKELLIYVHIPKTAGTTFSREILHSEYGKTRYNIFPFHKDDKINRDQIEGMKKSLPNLNLISGHFGYNMYLHNTKISLIDSLDTTRNISHITILRNPIDRVISEFYFFKRICKTSFPESLEKYVERKATVANCLFANNADMPFSMLFTPNMQTLFVTGGKYDIELAKYNLRHKFKAVGITEYLYESFLMMKKMFKWNINSYESVNINKKKPKRSELSNKLISKIREANSLDMELYNYALTLFKQKLRQLNIPIRVQV